MLFYILESLDRELDRLYEQAEYITDTEGRESINGEIQRLNIKRTRIACE